MNSRKEAFSKYNSSGVRSERNNKSKGLTLVKKSIKKGVTVEVKEADQLELILRESQLISGMGMAVGSEYGANFGSSEEVNSKSGTVISSTDRKKTVLIIAGPDDHEANQYASSLASEYDVMMTSNIIDSDKVFSSANPEVLMVFVNKIEEREVLNYVKYLTDKNENKNLLVLAASRFEKLEERLQFYWAGIDTHVLLPASTGEIENIIQGWEV